MGLVRGRDCVFQKEQRKSKSLPLMEEEKNYPLNSLSTILFFTLKHRKYLTRLNNTKSTYEKKESIEDERIRLRHFSAKCGHLKSPVSVSSTE
jgi:hypothetical protein